MKIFSPLSLEDPLFHSILLALSLGAVLVTLAGRYTASSRQSKSKLEIDEPPKRKIHTLASCMPVFGDTFEMMRNSHRLYDWMTEKSLEFNGEPWRIKLFGMQNFVVISTPDLVEEVTATQFENFPRGEHLIGVMVDLLGRSLVTEDGQRWFHQRKAAAKFFTAKALRECMTTNMRKNVQQVCGVFDKHTAERKPVDAMKVFHEFALQTFAEVGLGIELNIIGSEGMHPMDHAEAVTPVVTRRLQVPDFVWKTKQFLNIGDERIVKKALAGMQVWLEDVVEQSLEAAAKRLAARQADPMIPAPAVKSVVELYLEQSTEDKDGLRAENLLDFVRMILFASRSTSATALTWTVLMITKHPHVEKRIREEMARVLADVDEDEYLTTEYVDKLTFLEATIRETLRLYPPLPFNQKEAAVDTVIGGDLQIRKTEIVAILPYMMARMPQVWGPDAAEFKPERWINATTGQLITQSSFKYSTFGGGPRICIGMKLAMLELRIVLANLLRQYDIALATPNDCGYLMAMDLVPSTPVMIHTTRRKAASRA